MRFFAGFVCGAVAVPVALMIALHSERVEDLVMRVLNSEWVERRWE